MWTDVLTPVRWIYRGLLLLVLLVFTVPTVACQYGVGRKIPIAGRSLDEFMLNWWGKLALLVFGVRSSVEGAPLDGPVLIVANHVSWLDIQLLHSVASMSFVAKAEINRWPVMGFLASSGGTVYHQRGSHDSASGVVQQLLDKLGRGGRVAIFPEGGILPGAGIKRFHARMFKVAVESPCPVQAVMIRYTRGGKVDNDMTFIRGESFLVNIIRLLGRPASTGELVFLEPFEVDNRPRKQLAEQAQSMVEMAFDR